MSQMTKSTSPQAAWTSNNHWGFSQKRGKSIYILTKYSFCRPEPPSLTKSRLPQCDPIYLEIPMQRWQDLDFDKSWQVRNSSDQCNGDGFWLKTVYHPPHWRSCTWSLGSQLKSKSMRKTKYIEKINSPQQLDFPTYGVEQVDFIAPVVGVSGRSALGGFHLPEQFYFQNNFFFWQLCHLFSKHMVRPGQSSDLESVSSKVVQGGPHLRPNVFARIFVKQEVFVFSNWLQKELPITVVWWPKNAKTRKWLHAKE